MSFIAQLVLEEEEMNVLHCTYGFNQDIDATGKPTAIPLGGSVNLVLESNGKTDLFDWMISPTQTKKGIITFYRSDNMIKLKTLEFTDAYCVSYRETFGHKGEEPMQVNIQISARKLKLNDSAFEKNWPK
ncbi:hypothetical protein EXU57_23130 [Segetibacter sp. 3557_3]|uniref:type VI secretion system tube protein TssD n=1 Tax=Segetibacter sp. 3557_3 TaxID=2547429 RepID=UPI001058C31B|nr:type VI secretion system tube protein TssD [Segetibacter sp. 3557_3]TDH18493.1 hypothetical protein EXU57_23130 [Segetibacter sp. 3557_3]